MSGDPLWHLSGHLIGRVIEHARLFCGRCRSFQVTETRVARTWRRGMDVLDVPYRTATIERASGAPPLFFLHRTLESVTGCRTGLCGSGRTSMEGKGKAPGLGTAAPMGQWQIPTSSVRVALCWQFVGGFLAGWRDLPATHARRNDACSFPTPTADYLPIALSPHANAPLRPRPRTRATTS